MFSLSPPERKALVAIALVVFLGTLIRYFNLEVKDVASDSISKENQSPKININQVSATGLQRLPGIGPVLSRRIIEYRKTRGLFKDIIDLKKIKGIGEHKAEAIKDYIEF